MYLLAQIWWLLLVTFLLGVLLGYVVWRACGLLRLKSLARRDSLIVEDRIRALERDNARLEDAVSNATRAVTQQDPAKTPTAKPAALARPVSPPPVVPRSPQPADANGARPRAPDRFTALRPPMPMPPNGNSAAGGELLDSPRNGKADNLRLIRGVGPRLEKILNSMGVYHFDQIANWTERDLAIVDAYLGDFAGRAVRDKWIEQSRKLAGLNDAPKGP